MNWFSVHTLFKYQKNMTSEKLAWHRENGRLLDPKFDRLAVIGDKRKEKEELAKIENTFSEEVYINNIEDISFINQTLSKSKKNSANGFYYLYDGTFLGNYGNSKEVVVCAKKSDREDKKSKKKWQEFLSPIRLIIENDDFIHFSATIFAESLLGYEIVIKEEVFAFAKAIGNYIIKEKEDKNKELTYREAITANGVYGADSPNYINFINEKDRNSNSKMMLALSGVINELTNGFDYSYGATLWDGIDIKRAKWKDGLEFAKDIHDVFGLKDNKNAGKEYWKDIKKKETKYLRRKWDYKYITTIAYSGENKKRKNGYYPYYEGDIVNMFKYGTTFMKTHPDFEKIIPNKTKTDDLD
jgi:hypothetical protein